MRNGLSRILHTTSRRSSSSSGSIRRSYTNLRDVHSIEGQRKIRTKSYGKITRIVSTDRFLQQHYSTGFTSVHGGRPSSEYAKRRKESLETEFGTILGTYSSKTLLAYYRFGPFLALYRAAIISFQVAKLTVWHIFLQDIHKRAVKFRETLVRLGPFYIKLGQALSTRPDILPNAYCHELSKLQDQIPPFPTHVAIKLIESQLDAPIKKIFADISDEPVATASLGQVYKAHLHSGETVAVKVQRPGMPLMLTLDALLFHMIGGQLKRFAKAHKDLFVAVNEMVRHMFEEIDYILEAQNAERFSSLFSSNGGDGRTIKVPKIYWEFTNKAVLTMEWIDGIKLTDSHRINEASLNKKELIDQGVYCSLRQLLEEGFFHADPHPGNLVATDHGSLAYFDFGMMGDIPRHYRVGLIQVLVHFVNRDSWGLANDFLSLGFIPDGADLKGIADALQASFGDSARQTLDFQIVAISEQASEGNGGTIIPSWRSFEMRAVVNATEDLLLFILSQKGQMVRVFLIRDIIKAIGSVLDDGDSAVERVFNGLGLLRTAVQSTPEVWVAMMLRMGLRPEFHRFAADMASALVMYSWKRFPEAFWFRLSALVHKISATG